MGSQEHYESADNCLKAIDEVCRKAVPCIKQCIGNWRQRHVSPLGTCTTTATCPTTGSKPKADKGSCQSCIDWGQALETQISGRGQITWSNLNPTLIGTDPFEIAKGFVLRMKTGQTFTDFSDFDSASLLMIMKGFKEFHQNNRAFCGIIKKVIKIKYERSLTTSLF